MLCGVSTARIEKNSVRREFRKLFDMVDCIATRDDASLDEILKISPSALSKARSLADLVFTMREELEGNVPASERPVIGFAVHNAPGFSLTDCDEAEALLRRVAGRISPEQRIAVLAHDRREDWDLGIARQLADRLAPLPVSCISFETAAESISFYRDVRTMISVRMHPIIMAACSGAFCVPLRSSRKVADIGKRLEVPVHDASSLMDLGDSDFDSALGLDNRGPLPSGQAINAMAEAAQAAIPPVAGP